MKKASLKINKKIESPLAKYNSIGQLFCVLCNSPVKNEMFWTGHINGKAHRDNITALKDKSNKRPSDSTQQTTPNKLAKISDHNSEEEESHTFKVPQNVPKDNSKTISLKNDELKLKPFTSQIINKDDEEEDENNEDEIEESNSDSSVDSAPNPSGSTNVLPEGFFDDPKKDAKARGVEWRDPEELEWDNFMKEIANEEIKSSGMRILDEEESTVSRELDEIEDQMAHWQRVLELEKKAEEVRRLKSEENKKMEVESDDEEEIEFDEDLNWRSKKH